MKRRRNGGKGHPVGFVIRKCISRKKSGEELVKEGLNRVRNGGRSIRGNREAEGRRTKEKGIMGTEKERVMRKSRADEKSIGNEKLKLIDGRRNEQKKQR